MDITDYSQSILTFFPHFYRNYHDSHISTKSYHRNCYHARENYFGGNE